MSNFFNVFNNNNDRISIISRTIEDPYYESIKNTRLSIWHHLYDKSIMDDYVNKTELYDLMFTGYNDTFFFLLDFIIVVLAVSVITSNSPIVAILFLIALFLVISCRLIIIGMTFIGLSYLLVYVGAVSMLFLFILMLINIKLSELHSYSYNIIPLATYIGLLTNYIIWQMLPSSVYEFYNTNEYSYYPISTKITTNELFISSNYWDASIYETTHMIQLGNLIYSDYFMWLVITSVILLLSMVGAIIITMKKP